MLSKHPQVITGAGGRVMMVPSVRYTGVQLRGAVHTVLL